MGHYDDCRERQITQQKKKADNVNHPKHYTSHPSGVETIQITEHMNFNLGNVIKYVMRHDLKGGLEDLKKARWYLDREIKRKEGCIQSTTQGVCAPSLWINDK